MGKAAGDACSEMRITRRGVIKEFTASWYTSDEARIAGKTEGEEGQNRFDYHSCLLLLPKRFCKHIPDIRIILVQTQCP